MTDVQKQCILAYFGCLPPSYIDGIWGGQSAKATEELQRKLDIPDDGVWGPQTEKRVREVIGNGEEPIAEDKPEENTTASELWAGIRYWTPEEFKCRCGEYHAPYCDGFPVQPDRTLLEVADDIRERLGKPAHRSSAIRCIQHNADEGGVYNSRHLSGKALDFFVEGVSGSKLLAEVQGDPRVRYAYIIGGQYVHMDVK